MLCGPWHVCVRRGRHRPFVTQIKVTAPWRPSCGRGCLFWSLSLVPLRGWGLFGRFLLWEEQKREGRVCVCGGDKQKVAREAGRGQILQGPVSQGWVLDLIA